MERDKNSILMFFFSAEIFKWYPQTEVISIKVQVAYSPLQPNKFPQPSRSAIIIWSFSKMWGDSNHNFLSYS